MKCSTVRTDCIAIMITLMFFRCPRFALLRFGFTDNHTKSKYMIVKKFLNGMVFVEITLFKVSVAYLLLYIFFILEKFEKKILKFNTEIHIQLSCSLISKK